jgi:hypothetical protein
MQSEKTHFIKFISFFDLETKTSFLVILIVITNFLDTTLASLQKNLYYSLYNQKDCIYVPTTSILNKYSLN